MIRIELSIHNEAQKKRQQKKAAYATSINTLFALYIANYYATRI